MTSVPTSRDKSNSVTEESLAQQETEKDTGYER